MRNVLFRDRESRLSALVESGKWRTPETLEWSVLTSIRKSQLAIEYSYTIRESSPTTWVLWVHASNASRFEESFRQIADRAKIPERFDSKISIFKVVHDWLADVKEKWVIILDNVDDDQFLYEPSTKSRIENDSQDGSSKAPLLTFIPQSSNGSVLWTTRSRRVATRAVNVRNILSVEPMDISHAVALMERKLTSTPSQQDMIKLTQALECMPLAIVQAAAYIEHRAPRCSVLQYLVEFEKNDQRRSMLLDHEAGQTQRDWEAANCILLTWQISFDYIQKTRQSAANLLSLMSFFDRQGIPENFIKNPPDDVCSLRQFLAQQGISEDMTRRAPDITGNRGVTESQELKNQDCVREEQTGYSHGWDEPFEEDIMMLREYSFISANRDPHTFEMHRLVQLAMRKWLTAHGEEEIWKIHFLWNVHRECPEEEFDQLEKFQSLFPHIVAAMSQRPALKQTLLKWISLLRYGAHYAYFTGNTPEMLRIEQKASAEVEKLLGSNDINTINANRALAYAYMVEGRLDDAEALQLKILMTSQSSLGETHRATLEIMQHLSVTYQEQRKYQDAMELQTQGLEASKATFGADDQLTMKFVESLASTYRKQGRIQEAEPLHLEYLDKATKVLGERHPDVLAGLAHLAMMYSAKGRKSEAEKLQLKVLECSKSVLGETHPHTTASMINLARYKFAQRWQPFFYHPQT
jgi:tetratricopeptide (TPR) repeat protein